MKKWLVGLVAAGLCAASAWAASYTWVKSADKLTEGNYVIVAGQGDSAMKNVADSKGRISAEAVTVTDGVITDPDDSLVWTLTQDDDAWIISSETSAGTVYAAAPSSEGNSSRLLSALADTYTLWTIADSATADLITVGSYEYLDRCLQKNDSGAFFACYKGTQTDVRFFKEDSSEFSVVIVPSDEFSKKESGEYELTEGTEFAHLTATAKNGESPYTFSWTGATWAGDYVELEGETLDIPSDLAEGEYYVTVWATDSSEEPQRVEAGFTFTVVPAPQTYTVTVADGIENGSVAVWDGETELGSPAEVLEGTLLKVVATPATRSYKVESVTVTGETSGETIALENGGFTMPAENVSVTATFVERTGDLFEKITSVDGLEAGAYVITGAAADGTEYAMLNEANTSTSTDHIKRKETPEDVVNDSISGPEGSIVWTLAKDDTGWTIYNADGGYVCYVPNMGNSANLEEEPSARSHWTIAATGDGLFEVANVGVDTRVLRYNSGNPRFACYTNATGKSLAFYKRSGPGTFSLALDPANDFDVPEGTEATITATANNAQGEVTYTWNVTQDDTPGSAEGNVWTIPADAPAGGPWTVYCNANDGTSEADASVSFSIVAAPAIYDVTIAEGIENGTVTVEPASGTAGTEITVTTTPDDGYALVTILVNGDPIGGNTFDLPEGGATVGAIFEESSVKFATYTVESTSAVSTTGVVPEGSEALYASTYNTKCQLIGGTKMTLTLSGYEGATIKGLTLSMHSNTRGGAGSLDVTVGDEQIAAIADARFSDASWYGAWSSSYVDIPVSVPETVVDGKIVITIAASANSLFCESFTVEYEPGTPAFSVALDPAEAFEVVEGEAFSIEATAKNAAGEVAYAWTVDGVPAETDGNLLSLVAGEADETPHVVVCTATDTGAEGVTAEATVSYTVVAAPALHTVSVAGGIENGEVALSVAGEPLETPAEVEEGTEVTVTATPADGYALEAITVNGTALEGTTTFTVTENTEVSATFTKVVDYAMLPFLAENTPFTGPWQNPREAGVTAEGLGTDYNNASDGRGAKFDTTGDWLQVKFEGTPGELTYALKGNGTSAEQVSTFDVVESATGEDGTWTPVATHKSGENLFNNIKTNFTAELKADSRFVKFVYTERVQGNVGLFDVYISSGAFSVAVDKTGFELEEGTADTVTAEAKNGTEPYAYVWTSETAELNGEGAALAIPDTLAAGEYAATVTATDAGGQTATADVAFTVVEPAEKFPVEIAIGILNGTVEADVDEAAAGEPVTVTATPAPGFKLGILTVTYYNSGETLEFTTSPATFAMPEEKVLVGASFLISNDEIFVPVESEAEFEAGGEYLIVARKEGSFTDALKNAPEGSRIGVDAVAIEADGYVKTDNADIVWKIQAGKAEGQYVLFNEAASVYAAATKNDNLAQLLEEGTNDLAQWTLDLSALPAVKIVSVSYTNRWLQRNNNTAYFATYTGTQTTPQLFKKVESLDFAVSVDKTGFELALGEGTTVTATAKFGTGDVSYAWTSETEELNGAGALLEIPATLPAGEYAATVTATDSSEPPQTATADVAFTVVAPLPVYTVTVAEGIENGTVTVDKTEAEQGETVTVTATPDENYKLEAILVNGVAIEGNTFEIAGDSVVSATFSEIVKHPVVIFDGILNGTVEADKEEAAAGETVTLTATPADGFKLEWISVNGERIVGTSFEMPDDDALVTASFVERIMTAYELVESAEDFEVGAEYLVVAHKAETYTDAMKNAPSGNRIGVDAVEFATETTIETDSDAIVWTIQAGAEEGQVVLFNAAAGVYAAALSDGNNAQLVTDADDELAQWTLDLTALPAVKFASVKYPSRYLQRNKDKGNAYFANYSTEQAVPSLYKKVGPAPFSVGFDKEDGFTVALGTADSITASAANGTEPYAYVWSGDLEGDTATLEIPATLEAGEYSVTVTATDASDEPQTATASISFTVVAKYAITVAEGIVGGEVAVDKELAEAGETVTVTATPASGYELAAITVNGTPLTEGNTFVVEGDSVVSATFNEIVDYATLPFKEKDTPYSGPWQTPEAVGLTVSGLGSDYRDGSAKFDDTGDWMQIKFQGTPGTLSYGIKGNGTVETSNSVFAVFESADGENWTAVAVYETGEKTVEGSITLGNAKLDERYPLAEDSRFVKFSYETKGAGNVGIYDVYISEAGELEPTVTVTGETTLTLGDTFALELALENYTGEYTWTNDVPFGSIYAETATFWWVPTRVGEFPVTFMAMDGERVIASAPVTLTVLGEPALVFGGDAEGTAGTPVNFTVAAEYVADPAVTFMGFLEVPEGSALTAADVVLDFPNVTFTPDVAGEYGLAFSAGTAEGGDYVEDAWIVTVAPAPAEPEVTLVDGETTVEFGDYFLLEFALSNYEGEFSWTADVGEIDEDGLFTWTPTEAGEFPVVVSAVSGEETIASTTVTLTVTGEEPPVPVPAAIKEMVFDAESSTVLLRFEGDGTAVYGTTDLNGEWVPVDGAVVEGDLATVPMTVPFLRVQ